MSACPKEYWNPIPIDPQLGLHELREMVLANSEKRMPKWKFRVASDLVLQIQPQRPSRKYAELFEGRAFEYDGANGKAFESREEVAGKNHALVYFELRGTLEELTFKPCRAGGPRMMREIDPIPNCPFDTSRNRRKVFDVALATPLRDRLVEVFNSGYFTTITPGKMLSPNCLCCGKGLTDPASMARMIGPECWGSGSLLVPWLYEPQEEVHQ